MPSWRVSPERLSPGFRVYRLVEPGLPAMWRSPSVAAPSPQPAARWHVGGAFAQYCSLETVGAWAEYARGHEIATPDEAEQLRAALWLLEIEEPDIADLSTFDAFERCGLDPATAIADDHASCQALASELQIAGYTGLASPSAALPGATNVTLFGARRELEMTVPENRRVGAYVRCELIGVATPPAYTLDWVRRRGAPHLGFDDWYANRLR